MSLRYPLLLLLVPLFGSLQPLASLPVGNETITVEGYAQGLWWTPASQPWFYASTTDRVGGVDYINALQVTYAPGWGIHAGACVNCHCWYADLSYLWYTKAQMRSPGMAIA